MKDKISLICIGLLVVICLSWFYAYLDNPKKQPVLEEKYLVVSQWYGNNVSFAIGIRDEGNRFILVDMSGEEKKVLARFISNEAGESYKEYLLGCHRMYDELLKSKGKGE